MDVQIILLIRKKINLLELGGLNEADVATFFSDGTCSLGAGILSGGGNWEIKDGMLVLSVDNYIIMALNYSFSDNNNYLTITQQGGGMSSTYHKQLS